MRYVTSKEIDKAVRELYQKNGFVVLSEVRNGTGFERAARTADMILVSTWPSRGLFCEGVEIKVSRSDLQKELENPQKADAIARYCTRWWLAMPDDINLDGLMIPESWGIIAVDIKGKAKARGGKPLTPIPMDTLLVCSILRNFAESHVHVSEVEPKIKAARAEGEKASRDWNERRVKELEEAIQKFKEHSGIDLMGSHGHPRRDIKGIGAAIELLIAMRRTPVEEMRHAAESLREAGAAIDAALKIVSTEVPA